MILLAIITVGTLSLSVVTLRSSGYESPQNIARANARMALMLAIGELQRHTGQDTRITASATIVNENYPQVLGVWRSWEGTDHLPSGRPRPPVYSAKDATESNGGTGRFLNWLVSTAVRNATPTINDADSLVEIAPTDDTIPLLAEGSLQASDTRQIHVEPTILDDDGDNIDDGRFAWWISGENQKALLAQPFQPRNEDASALAEMGQSHTISDPTVFGLPSLITDPEPHNPGAADAKPGSKTVSRQTMAVIEDNNAIEPHKKFHDLSSYSIGLLTNSATGGWRKDLSLLTEKWDAIYASTPGGRLPLFRLTPTAGAAATTQVPRPTVGNAAANHSPTGSNFYPWSNTSRILGTADLPVTFHAASASWKSLVSFATAYKNFSDSAGGVQSPWVWDKISSTATAINGSHIFNYRHTQRLYPQVARFQFIVYARATQTSGAGVNPVRYRVDLMYCPIFTLWNPYNVGLTYTIPANPVTEAVGFGWRRGLPAVMAVVNQTTYPNPDLVPTNQFRLFSAGNFQYLDVGGNYGNEYDTNLVGNTLKFNLAAGLPGAPGARCNAFTDYRAGICSLSPGTLTLKPGEAKIFSPNGNTVVGFGNTGIQLSEGHNPANVSGRQVNGVAANLTAAQRLWFLLRTDKFTQPYRTRNSGLGFALSFGKTTGNPYLGMALHSSLNDEYHNMTALAPETIANTYWPPTEVDEIGYSVAELASGPWIPIFSSSFGPRTTIGTGPGTEQNRPTKGVLQSNPLASMSLINPTDGDPKSHPGNGTFDITYHSLSLGSTLTPNLSTSKGFIATGYQSGDGLSRLVMCDIPLRPMASLVELQGWNPRGNNPYPPFQSNLIGNSDATPLIPNNQVVPTTMDPPTVQTNLQHDDAYCANHLLFDDWFVSSIGPQPYTFGGSYSKDIDTFYQDYLKGEEKLTNRVYRRIQADSNLTPAQVTALNTEIINTNPKTGRIDGWLKVASRFEVEGMFNVNTTSVEAWKALLGRAKSLQQIAMHGETEVVSANVSSKHLVTRGPIASDVEAGSGAGFGGQFANASEYAGFRSLSDEQIEDLAEKIVEQVRLRGPFLSLSEFVNRQLSTNEDLALAGAIQTAINNLDQDPMATLRNPANSLSDNTMAATDAKLAGVNYEFNKAAEGSSAYGAPGWIRQADILRPIAPILSVRDDTFTIRAYGDALDKEGNKVVAQAWCEATVKRTRDFADPADAADSIDPPTNPMNVTFGRYYEIVSFRWLNADEV